MLLLLCLATFLGIHLLLFAFCGATMLAGGMAGITCDQITIGFGPRLLHWEWHGCEFEWRLLPLTAHAKYRGLDAQSDAPRIDSFQAAPLGAKLLVALAGPVAQILLGAILLMIPVALGAPRLQAHDEATAQPIRPRALPALALADENATLADQFRFVWQTGGEFSVRLYTFRSLEGCGGYVGLIVTASAVALASPPHWCSCLGVLSVMTAAFNLLPIPPSAGGRMVLIVVESLRGRAAATGEAMLMLLGTIVLLVLAARVALADAIWIWHALT